MYKAMQLFSTIYLSSTTTDCLSEQFGWGGWRGWIAGLNDLFIHWADGLPILLGWVISPCIQGSSRLQFDLPYHTLVGPRLGWFSPVPAKSFHVWLIILCSPSTDQNRLQVWKLPQLLLSYEELVSRLQFIEPSLITLFSRFTKSYGFNFFLEFSCCYHRNKVLLHLSTN